METSPSQRLTRGSQLKHLQGREGQRQALHYYFFVVPWRDAASEPLTPRSSDMSFLSQFTYDRVTYIIRQCDMPMHKQHVLQARTATQQPRPALVAAPIIYHPPQEHVQRVHHKKVAIEG